MKVLEISYLKDKYPKLRKLGEKIVPIGSVILLCIVIFSAYFSWNSPKGLVFFILVFVFFTAYIWWLIRGIEYIFLLIVGLIRYRNFQKLNLQNIFNGIVNSKEEKRLFKLYKQSKINKEDIYHWLIIPTYKDPYEMLEDTFESIKNSDYPNEKILITLAGEYTDKENFQKIKEKISQKYGSEFAYLNFTVHKLQKGELQGKGSNVKYAAKSSLDKILKFAKAENVLVSVLDSESILQKTYFNALTLEYCITLDDLKDKTIYQPMLFLLNRFFEAPYFAKIMALSVTFYILGASVKNIGTRAQAVQAQSLKSLIETNFYSSETITEDGHQYYRTYFTFNGKFQVKPVYSYVLLEPVIGKHIGESLKMQYNQIKRWAHGCLDIPYVICAFKEKFKYLPFFRTLYELFWLIEASVLWSSLQFILFIGTIIFMLIGGKFSGLISFFGFFSLLVLVLLYVVSLFFFPWKKILGKSIYEAGKYGIFSFTIMGPLLLILNGLPALHAQLMILFGKAMGKFNVTKKYRKTVEGGKRQVASEK